MRHLGPPALLLVLTSACGDASVGAGRGLLSAIPADAAIVVSAIDFEVIRERASENHFVELFGGQTWDDAKAVFNAAIQKGDGEGFDIPAAFAAVRGEAVFFFRFVGEGQKTEFGFLVEATPEDTEFVRLWEGLRGLAEEENGARRVERRGSTMHVIDAREQTAFFRHDGVYGLTVSEAETEDPAVALADGMLDRLARGDDSFASSPGFRAAFSGRAANPALLAYVDGQALYALFARYNSPRDAKALTQLGISRMRWGALDLDLGAGERLELHVATHVPDGTFLAEVLGHLGRAPTELLSSLPRSAYYATVGEIDAVGLFHSVMSFTERVDERGYSRLIRDLEEMREELGVDLERDVLAGLSGRFAAMGVPTSVSSEQMIEVTRAMSRSPIMMVTAMASAAYYFELEDADIVKGAVDTLVTRMAQGMRIHEEEFLGHQINHVMTPLPVAPRWAFHDDLFVLSIQDSPMRSAIEALARKGRGSFVDLRGVSSRIDDVSSASIASIARTRGVVDGLIGLLRSLGFSAAAGRDRDLQAFARIRWPSPLVTPDLFEGYIVQTVTRDGERLAIDIVAR